jgi:hypothetical protein
MPATAADVPLPQPPQPQGSSIFGSPRRVSTVAVKPDGSIAANAKPPSDNSPPLPPKRLTLASADAAATPVPDAASPVTPPPAAKKPAEPSKVKPVANADPDTKPAKPAAKPKPKAAESSSATPHADDSPADGAPLSITPQGHHRRTVVASADPQTSPREAAANEPNAARGESGFSIQLAASQSESDARATLSRLQRQFPNVLGGGSIRRANLGSKGVYYRVRVGPLSRDAADKLCSQIKAGGAACILTRG